MYQFSHTSPDIEAYEQMVSYSHGDLLRVPKKLSNPHRATMALKKLIDSASRKSTTRKGKGIVKVDVSRSSFDRALRIIDALIKLVEARGHQIGNQVVSMYEVQYS